MEYEMQVYEKQVKALRTCSSEINCGECPFSNNDSCSPDDMMQDAANSIEELMAQVKDKDYLIQQQTDEIERLRRDVKKQQEKMIELAKRLPHWVSVEEPPKKYQRAMVFSFETGEMVSGTWTDFGWMIPGPIGKITHYMPIEPPEEVQDGHM